MSVRWLCKSVCVSVSQGIWVRGVVSVFYMCVKLLSLWVFLIVSVCLSSFCACVYVAVFCVYVSAYMSVCVRVCASLGCVWVCPGGLSHMALSMCTCVYMCVCSPQGVLACVGLCVSCP